MKETLTVVFANQNTGKEMDIYPTCFARRESTYFRMYIFIWFRERENI